MGLDNLPHACRAHRMTVPDQPATGINRNLEVDLAANVFAAHLRERGRAALGQLSTFPGLSQPENFVGDDFGNRKTIVYLGAMEIMGFEVCHRESLLRRLARGAE